MANVGTAQETSSRGSSFTKKIYELSKETRSPIDELDSYLLTGVENIKDGDIPHYWRLCSDKLPTLSRMARDYLATPATSACSERAFSNGRDLIGLDRHSLHSETMEACMCLKSWFKAGIMSQSDISREDVEIVLDEFLKNSDQPTDSQNNVEAESEM